MKATHGAPNAPHRKAIDIPDRVIARVLRRYYFESPTGCHISTYSTASHGYAQVGWHESGKRTMALCHRVAWIATYGPIPDGMTIDHMCRSRQCINLEHLRMLPNLENARRTSGRDWAIGTCIRGHSPEHWRPKSETLAKGYCTICDAENQARYKAKKRAA